MNFIIISASNFQFQVHSIQSTHWKRPCGLWPLWPRSLVLNLACSAYFFSRNSVFLSQQFSRNSVFQPVSAKVQTSECGVWRFVIHPIKRLLFPKSHPSEVTTIVFCYLYQVDSTNVPCNRAYMVPIVMTESGQNRIKSPEIFLWRNDWLCHMLTQQAFFFNCWIHI